MVRMLIIVLLVLSSSHVYGFDMQQEDKQKHFGVSASIAAPTYLVLRNNNWKRWQSVLMSIGVSLAFGHAKELSDKNYDYQDMQVNAVGAFSGAMIPMAFTF